MRLARRHWNNFGFAAIDWRAGNAARGTVRHRSSRTCPASKKRHHPLLVPTTGDAYPAWTFEHFKRVLVSAKSDEIVVLQFHGVPDEKRPWVNTPQAAFSEYMTYLKQNGYRALAMRDLLQYYDPSRLPDDPLLKARCCRKTQ